MQRNRLGYLRRSMRAGAILSLAVAASLPTIVSAAPADQFVFYYNGNTIPITSPPGSGFTAIGGFSAIGDDTFFQGNFSGAAQGIYKVSNAGTTSWSADQYVGATDWVQKFLVSTDVATGAIDAGATASSSIGDLVLNPAALTINGITYNPGQLGVIIEGGKTSVGGVNPALSKLVYTYDLRKIGAAAGAGRDWNSNGIAEWNDVFTPIVSFADQLALHPGVGTTTNNVSRRFAFSSDGQSIYFVDSTSPVCGGIYKVNLASSGSGAISKLLTSTQINTEPAVIHTSVRDFGGGFGAGDQIVFRGADDIGNAGGLSYIVDTGSENSTPTALLTAKQFASFFDITGAISDIRSVAADGSGNLYLANAPTSPGNPVGTYLFDSSGRLVKISSGAEQRVFVFNQGTAIGSQLDIKVRNATVSLAGGGSASLPQVLYSDNGLRAPVGITVYKPGDFNRDNVVDGADITAFKAALGLRGQVVASIATSTPFAQINTDNLKYDLNGSNQVSGIVGVSIDWKDVKILQQFAGLSDGDVNMDFAVDNTDLTTIAANYNGANNKLFTDGNLTSVRIDAADKDTVNYADLITLAANWTTAKPALGAVGSIPQADLDRAFAITANGAISQYVARAGGTWSDSAVWSNGVPNSPGAVASLLTKLQDDATINVDGSYTIGQLNFDSFFSYSLQGNGALHLQGANGATAEINAFAASPSISVGLALDSDTNVTVTYGLDSATFSGQVSGVGNLTKSGAGVLFLSGNNMYSGTTTVNGGVLQGAKPASLPGYNSPGKISVAGGSTLAVNAGSYGEWHGADIDVVRANAAWASGSALGIDTSNNLWGFTYTSDISGSGLGLTKFGANTLALSGNNTYTGATNVNSGVLLAGQTASLPGYNLAGKIAVAGGATLAVNAGGAGEWIAGDIVTLRSNATFATGSAIGIDTSNAPGGFSYGSILSGAGIGLTKLGANTLTLSAANTYTGQTTALGGTLQLDFSAAGAPAMNIIAAASSLQLGSNAGLTVTGKTSTTNSQAFFLTKLLPGSAEVAVNASPTANPVLLALGGLSSRTVGGTVNLNLPAGTQNATNGITTASAVSNGILGGWATVGKTTWAAKSGSNIIPLATYANDTWAAANNTTVTAGNGVTNATTNSLRFNNSGAFTVTISGVGTISSGGILVTSNVGNNASTISGGTLVGAAGKDLVVNQFNSANRLQIDSAIANNTNRTGLTKAGAGALVLTGNNTYSGGTHVTGGTLTTTHANALGTGSLNVYSGATAILQAGLGSAVKLAALNLYSPGATVDVNDNDLVIGDSTLASAIISQIKNARNGGAWDQPGITSSTAAGNPEHNTTLGVLSGAEYSSVVGNGAFSGQSYAATDTLVKYTFYGDTDFNGAIGFDDYTRIDQGVNLGRSGWLNGDFDYSGTVSFDDYGLIDLAFNSQAGTLARAISFLSGADDSSHGMDVPSLQMIEEHLGEFGPQYAQAFLAQTPEPASIGFIGVIAATTLMRRRREFLRR